VCVALRPGDCQPGDTNTALRTEIELATAALTADQACEARVNNAVITLDIDGA
jgi:hypothetical protein